MIMIVELHMLQNFAPSNLNRDDTGSPKDCEFGGYRRARISSQCQKRAIRLAFRRQGLLPPEHLGHRTLRLVDAVAERLAAKGRDRDQAVAVIEGAIAGVGLKTDEGLTQYLIFLGEDELDRMADVCDAHWDTLAAMTADASATKKAAKAAVPKPVADGMKSALDGRRAADLGLFGRMLADLPNHNRQAAAQVAHAISTDRLQPEFDFFTAVDDMKPLSEDAGAGMLGTVEFNSSCYYRYANVDVDQLRENLGGDADLTLATLEAFLRASITAVPSGKQNTFAAHNPPSLVMTVVRNHGLWSLANAFIHPVAPTPEADLVAGSVQALDNYWGRLTAMYGDAEMDRVAVLADPGYAGHLDTLAAHRVENVEALVRVSRQAVQEA
jgi:CRISPR system Cascade subunit CasC